MDLETAAALLESDEIGPESLPGIAADALEEGTDSRSLRLLAGIAPFDPLDARDLFHQAMVELGISTQPGEAAMIAARWVAGQALNGSLSPQDACARIWRVYLRWIDDHPRPEELQPLGEVGQFAEYLEIPELRSAYGGRDQMERDAIAMLSRLASGEEVLGPEIVARRTEVSTAHLLSHLDRSDGSPAVHRRPEPGSLRPAFVWALAILLVPMLILFGFGFYNDTQSPWRFVAAPAYAVGAFVAPVISVRRSLRKGLHRTNAIAVGLAIASLVLIADLFLFSGESAYGAALVVAVAGGAIAFAFRWRPGAPPPPRPDLVPPRPDR